MPTLTWSDIRFFKKEEFDCGCCGANKMNLTFVQDLDDLREQLGFPLTVISGYRCAKHNKEVGGKENSAHMKGNASDIGIEISLKRYEFLSVAFNKFKRIGIGQTFIHVDDDESLPQYVCWMYK